MKKGLKTEFKSFRVRIILVLLLALSLYSCTTYLISKYTVKPALLNLEQTLARKEIQNFLSLINNEISALDTVAFDWAAWDDTYAFVQQPNAEFPKSNLTDATFINGKINLIVIYNNKGEIVAERILDLNSLSHIDLALFSPTGLSKDHLLLSHAGVKDFHRGFISTEKGPLVITSRPVITSDNKGPIRGTIIFGRFFFPDVAARLLQYENVTIQATAINKLSRDQRLILNKLKTVDDVVSYETDHFHLYAYLPDVENNPIIFFEFTFKRHLLQQVRQTLHYVLVFNFLIGIVLIGFLLLVFNRITLSTQRLIRNVHSFTYPLSEIDNLPDAQSSSLDTPIHLLSRDFHEKRIQHEHVIQVRTSDLQQTNKLLGQEIKKRIDTENKLLESRNHLEEKIEKRTHDLTQLTLELQKEIQERRESESTLKKQQKQLRRLSSELHSIEEKERRKIASDLHDRIGQSLTAMKIFIDGLGETGLTDSQHKRVDKINAILQQTIQDARTMTFEISPPVLYELGLEAALEWYIEQIQEQNPSLEIDLQCNQQPYELVPTSIQSLIFQTVRELLTNIVKHSQADYASISTSFDKKVFNFIVKDNGQGFDQENTHSHLKSNQGFGLFNIRERITSMNGSLLVESKPGQGSEIIISIPISS